MRRPPACDPHARLLPAGCRWGFGAHTVVPYLAHALQARAGQDPGEAIRNPVFPQMEKTLAVLRARR